MPTRARRPTSSRAACGSRAARIVFVTHGQASDPFWAVVKKGYNDAAKQTGTAVSYRAPDSFSIERMKRFIDQAIADKPDGLVVSIPDVEALRPSIEKAVAAGIPTITINSGSDEFKSLGVLAHVGQPEYAAGVESGERLAAAGVRQRAVRQPGVGQRRPRRALPGAGATRCARSAASARSLSRTAAEPGDRAAADGRRRSRAGRSTGSSRSARAARCRRSRR